MTFYELLTAAIADLSKHGYDSAERVEAWMGRIRVEAEATATPQYRVQEMLGKSLGAIYQRMVTKGGILKFHPGVSRWTVERLSPQMQAELRRRIGMSANLIKLNRENMIAATLRRFSGWASSVPAGGSEAIDKRDVKKSVGKALASLPFEERRVAIDQGFKFKAALSEIIANDGGALAVVWHSHYRQAGYDFREDHAARDGKVFAIRGNWASKVGLMTKGSEPYYDEVDGCGEAVYCRCYATYLYALRDLPSDMLTNKGRAELARVKIA